MCIPAEHQEADQSQLKLSRKVKDELTVSVNSDIVLKNTRIVVPTVVSEKAISLVHEGHQGLVKTKELLREKVWFPGMDHRAKRTIETCLACQANSPDNRPDPLRMSPLPPTGEYLLVVIDAYTRFPEVSVVCLLQPLHSYPRWTGFLPHLASQSF